MRHSIPTKDEPFVLIGRMVKAWNEAELVWFLIYTCLLHEVPRPVAEAIFKLNRMGAGQRDLIMAIAEVVLAPPEHRPILDCLTQARRETGHLAAERNAIVHGDYHYTLEDEVDFAALADPNLKWSIGLSSSTDWKKGANVFAGTNLDKELPTLLADIEQLVRQLDDIRHHLLWSYIPDEKRGPRLSENLPMHVRNMMLASQPELEPPTSALVWKPIRPIPRKS
jgi:hypothetical protein